MKKILVVDDSQTIRTLCEWIYKGLGDRLLTAESAQAARQVIDAESPDVVIVDYTLPDADSYEFVSSIKSRTHVVMMGGSYAPFSAERAKSSGAVAVITKPFRSQAFFDVVEEAASAVAHDVHAAAFTSGSGLRGVSSDHPAVASGLSEQNAEGTEDNAQIAASGQVFQKPTRLEGKPAGMAFGAHGSNAAAQVAAKRFNFPGTSPQSGDQAAVSVKSGEVRLPENATPRSPVPSISPAMTAPVAQQIDPAVLRAEVIAAVKSMLPAIVNSYLKKLIQAEVKPQLQNWVDTRVEALINRMNKDK